MFVDDVVVTMGVQEYSPHSTTRSYRSFRIVGGFVSGGLHLSPPLASSFSRIHLPPLVTTFGLSYQVPSARSFRPSPPSLHEVLRHAFSTHDLRSPSFDYPPSTLSSSSSLLLSFPPFTLPFWASFPSDLGGITLPLVSEVPIAADGRRYAVCCETAEHNDGETTRRHGSITNVQAASSDLGTSPKRPSFRPLRCSFIEGLRGGP
jgi:hypothetical protein